MTRKQSKKTATQTAAPPSEGPPQSGPPAVPMQVWRAASAHRDDQLAGFCADAKRRGVGPMRMTAWEQAYERFMNEPLEGGC